MEINRTDTSHIERQLRKLINGSTCSEKGSANFFTVLKIIWKSGRAERMKAADDFKHLLKQLF